MTDRRTVLQLAGLAGAGVVLGACDSDPKSRPQRRAGDLLVVETEAGTAVVDSVTGKVVGGPTVSQKGFSEDPTVMEPVVPLITEALDRAAAEGITDPHQLQQVVRRTVGRWVNDKYRRRPMIVPTVLEV